MPVKGQKKVQPPCSEEGCERLAYCQGMCKKHYEKSLKARNPEKIRTQARALRATNLERHRAYDKKFYEANPHRQVDRNSPENRAAWLSANVDKLHGYSSRWAKKFPEKAAKKTAARRNRLRGVDPAGLRMAHESGMRLLPCAQCGCTDKEMHVDHIIPLSWVDDAPELAELLAQPWCYQPLCESCNSSKSNRGVWCFVPTGDIG